MMTLIIWIIIITVIVLNIKKKGQKNYNNSSYNYGRMSQSPSAYRQNQGMNGTGAGTSQYHAGTNQSGAGSYQRTQNVKGTAAGYPSTAKGKNGGTASAVSKKAQEKEEKELSTLDYLNEKAKQDQREHAIEKMEERKRASEKYGNRPVGGRYLLGDPIPQGMKIVCCEYCGAENVVKIGYRGDRDCYFCRTRLED